MFTLRSFTKTLKKARRRAQCCLWRNKTEHLSRSKVSWKNSYCHHKSQPGFLRAATVMDVMSSVEKSGLEAHNSSSVRLMGEWKNDVGGMLLELLQSSQHAVWFPYELCTSLATVTGSSCLLMERRRGATLSNCYPVIGGGATEVRWWRRWRWWWWWWLLCSEAADRSSPPLDGGGGGGGLSQREAVPETHTHTQKGAQLVQVRIGTVLSWTRRYK